MVQSLTRKSLEFEGGQTPIMFFSDQGLKGSVEKFETNFNKRPIQLYETFSTDYFINQILPKYLLVKSSSTTGC